MSKTPWKIGAALLLALALTGAACSSRSDDASSGSDGGSSSDSGSDGAENAAFINPDEDCTDYQGSEGVEGDTIKIGTIRPESGPYAIYDNVTKGMEAYFNA